MAKSQNKKYEMIKLMQDSINRTLDKAIEEGNARKPRKTRLLIKQAKMQIEIFVNSIEQMDIGIVDRTEELEEKLDATMIELINAESTGYKKGVNDTMRSIRRSLGIMEDYDG